MKSFFNKITIFILVFVFSFSTGLMATSNVKADVVDNEDATEVVEYTEATETTTESDKDSDKSILEKKIDNSYKGTIYKSWVKLRRRPSKNSKVLRKISIGTKVTCEPYSKKWRKVTIGNKTGYVLKKYIYISTKAPKLVGTTKEKGKTVAAFAKRFIGNPYVWGGTNLNKGADCSGFVGAVYRSFGYRLPRTSAAQRRAGRKVSYKNKQPGDLICYYGHVAIYIGDGKIVHASSRRTGIKISDRANYRRIASVRRIVKK